MVAGECILLGQLLVGYEFMGSFVKDNVQDGIDFRLGRSEGARQSGVRFFEARPRVASEEAQTCYIGSEAVINGSQESILFTAYCVMVSLVVSHLLGCRH